MRVLIFLILLFTITQHVSANLDTLKMYRLQLDKAIHHKSECEKMLAHPYFHTGKRGVVWVVYSKHVLNPFNKIKYFNNGKDLVEKYLKEHPNDIEMIFFRYKIQTSIPKILNYKHHIVHDIKKLSDWLELKDLSDKDLYYEVKKTLAPQK
jgi:hypothetical protein